MRMILHKRDPGRHMARSYALSVQYALDLSPPDDSGAPLASRRTSLVREWGRIGSPGTIRAETHASPDAAFAAMDALAARKRRKGYR
jgi:predicted DNA-binding WGR domain protein